MLCRPSNKGHHEEPPSPLLPTAMGVVDLVVMITTHNGYNLVRFRQKKKEPFLVKSNK